MARFAHLSPRSGVLAALVVGIAVTAAAASWPSSSQRPDAHALRLSIVRALAERETAQPGPTRAARPSAVHFAAVPTTRARIASGALPTFGQPTISGVGGFGFEADLRLDPSDPSRIYTSVPATAGANMSWIWRSLDGGKTFKWVPSAAPLNGKAISCNGGGDTELAIDPAGRIYFNDLTAVNFSVARSDDGGKTFPCNNTGVPDAGVDRQWYALDGDPTAGGSLYLANDEIGTGNPQCGSSTPNNTLVMYRSPAGGAGATAGLAFGPANHITQPGSCDEGIMGQDEVSPVATKTGQVVSGQATTLTAAVKHIYVIHDDGTLSKIRIARCFPVAFGLPVANVSDPSGLNCVDLQVADLGDPATVRTGGNNPTMAIDRAGNLYAVWEQAPVSGGKTGDSSLMYAYSTNEGTSWSSPMQIPTPGLANNVYAWAAAGDDGRVDVAWYGTPTHADPNSTMCPNGGPDSAAGSWGLYLTQTQNGHAGSVTFTSPALASEHPVRRGGIQTLMGGQCAPPPTDPTATWTVRSLGDFFQLRIGSKGEAQMSYADSENYDGQIYGTHAMYVRQIGGPGVLKGKSPSGDPIQVNSVSDVTGDGTYDALGSSSPTMPNLDILGSSVSWPRASTCHPAGTACLRVKMKLVNLSTAAPKSPDQDTDLVWLTQWILPASPACTSTLPSCANGGLNYMVYAEWNGGSGGDGAFHCYVGQSALEQNLGGVMLTYPGMSEIASPGACAVVTGQGGTITIDVPLSQVSLDAGVSPFSSKIYSVTASTMTLPAPANSVPWAGGVGGIPFNMIDVARSYDGRP